MEKTMKSYLTTFLVLTSLILPSVKAEEVIIPKIGSPSILQEGTQRQLSAEQIAELLPWAKNSKILLVDLLDSVESLPTNLKLEQLTEGIKQGVVESAPKQSELIMRYSLNRALVINDILNKETDPTAVGSMDARLRVLMASIKFALKYYDADVAALSSKAALPFATFGIEYFSFLSELNKSIFDASAQYNIQKTALEFLQWDLYRDLNNAKYAPQIVKINTSLKKYPASNISDSAAISYIRQMKKTAQQLQLLPANSQASQVINSEVEKEKKLPIASVSDGFSVFNNYGVYKGYCYAASKEGKLLTSSIVSNSYCTSQYKVSSDGYCYAADKSGNLLKSTTVSNSSCTYQYKAASDGYCYAADEPGNLLKSTTVSNSSCTSQYKVSFDGYCYAADKSGTLLKSTTVSNSNCTHQYKVSSDGYCYAADKLGNLLKSTTVPNSYCQ
jgi:hypothetical protein